MFSIKLLISLQHSTKYMAIKIKREFLYILSIPQNWNAPFRKIKSCHISQTKTCCIGLKN